MILFNVTNLSFILVLFTSIAMGAGFLVLTRGITFFSTGTDNQKQVYAASQSYKWRWPSDMHKFSGGKSYMKDGVVLGLAMMQRVMRDKTSDYPLVALCAVSNVVSAVLIYIISYKYWGLTSALLVFVLYIFSVWPWQIALMGGHICVAQLFFLFSVFCLQLAKIASPYWAICWYVASGILFGLMQFSSASARKFTVLFAVAFLYTQRAHFFSVIQNNIVFRENLLTFTPVILWVGCLLLLLMCVLQLLYKPIISNIYYEYAPTYLNKFVKNRHKNSLEHYVEKIRKMLKTLRRVIIFLFIYGFVYLIFFNRRSFYLAQIPVILGLCVASLVLLVPNFAYNLLGYFSYFNMTKQHGHFRLYEEYFAMIGKPIKKNMRGAGLYWIIKYFALIAPFQFATYVLCLLFLIYAFICGIFDMGKIFEATAIILLSMSPILWGELTRGPQVGRSYFPGFLGLLVLIAFVVTQIRQGEISGHLFWFFIRCIVILNTVWNIWIFFVDVYPARMAPAWLAKKLKRLGIMKIYTYNTSFNDAFVNTMNFEDLRNFEISYINTIKDVIDDNAVVLVPGTSSKAFNMESQKQGYTNQDFRLDPFLNELIDSDRIKDCSIAQYKTFGTSKIWVHESEVSSYRSLILREINEKDRWRGYAWILSVSKLKRILS